MAGAVVMLRPELFSKLFCFSFEEKHDRGAPHW